MTGYIPLAARARPTTLEDYIGQSHILGEGKPLAKSLRSGQLHSLILWGPPGTGKTTLAQLCANYINAEFDALSAVLSGVKEVRAAVETAKQRKQIYGKDTLLFVDEVHRFNKAQQDAFLPHIEDGTIIFAGATTENPSFELNNALLSRCRTYVLKSLTDDDIAGLLATTAQRFFPDIALCEGGLEQLALVADGDARRALNLLELAMELASGESALSDALLAEVLQGAPRRFDKGGDVFYEQISALHKAVRGSSTDGALYWLARMLDGGCDPLYIARRVVRMASEEIGNADPRALSVCLDAWQVVERLGSPEGELALAQAVVYLASAPKSNAVYAAFKRVMADVKASPSYDVPMHLRNAPTTLMKNMNYGGEYRYAHDEEHAYAAGENYLPEAIADTRYYDPVDRGLEIKIGDKLRWLRELDAASPVRRYATGSPHAKGK